ncbi:MAG: response regulator transcription factor [Formosimonas sp.]|jgi:two-component system OmpR family response regulator
MRILLAEDDTVLANGLSRALRDVGYVVDVVGDGKAADDILNEQECDMVILDLGLPKMLGLEVLRRARARGNQTPILILTAGDSVEQRVQGLDLGADDFMAKPFSLSELQARVRALTRRQAGFGQSLLQLGALSFDQSSRSAHVNGSLLDLSAREVSVLEVLFSRAGRLVSKEQILTQLCEWNEEVSLNAIEVYVHRLRKKLEPSGVVISTIRGLGYCLEKPNAPAESP